MAEKKLSVKNLQISFRTNAGKVQAVREISFDLYKGETLAIVGESGSGKSVTSRAIMGILAGNAIVEGGKILYGDKDLLRVSEEEFHEIRGDKIAMVFQDPLSSLNPIMKIGQQLTEAMLLKNKASRKESKENLKEMFKSLRQKMDEAGVSNSAEIVKKFEKITLRQCKLQASYSDALAFANEASELVANALLKLEKNSVQNFQTDVNSILRAAKGAKERFVVYEKAGKLDDACAAFSADWKSYKAATGLKNFDAASNEHVVSDLKAIKEIVDEAAGFTAPDTMSLGYHLEYVNNAIPEDSVENINKLTAGECETGFTKSFTEDAMKAVRKSIETTDGYRVQAISVLNQKLPIFRGDATYAEAQAAAKEMKLAVSKCINPLEVVKDSITHTFPTSLDYAMEQYYLGGARNAAEEKRYNKMQAKYDAIVKRGKKPNWQVIPAGYIDLDVAKQDMLDTITEMVEHLQSQIDKNKECLVSGNNEALQARTQEVIDFLSENAKDSVYRVTKAVAREKAIKLMESVGIDNPRRRFYQYPFEFSGGMRQRIVIAIALTANPDVLICDEPTTALDVTIQAQILELINKLKEERDLSVIFITHDLGVVANMADRIAVMYAGKIVECGTAEDVFYAPAHPYTWALLSSVPDLDTVGKLESIPGTPPNMIYPPKGDAFAERNKYALEIDFEMQPPMFEISETHSAATWLLHPNAPKIDPPEIVTERIARMKKMRGENE